MSKDGGLSSLAASTGDSRYTLMSSTCMEILSMKISFNFYKHKPTFPEARKVKDGKVRQQPQCSTHKNEQDSASLEFAGGDLFSDVRSRKQG